MRSETTDEQTDGTTASDVVGWRRERLTQTGFPPDLVDRVVDDPRYDLHALIELVERGCPPELAVRILAPLEEGARH
jgi:hypothetical protein